MDTSSNNNLPDSSPTDMDISNSNTAPHPPSDTMDSWPEDIMPTNRFMRDRSSSLSALPNASNLLYSNSTSTTAATSLRNSPSIRTRDISGSTNNNSTNRFLPAFEQMKTSPRLSPRHIGSSSNITTPTISTGTTSASLAGILPIESNTNNLLSTPLSRARSILQPDNGSPSRSPQLSHGSLLQLKQEQEANKEEAAHFGSSRRNSMDLTQMMNIANKQTLNTTESSTSGIGPSLGLSGNPIINSNITQSMPMLSRRLSRSGFTALFHNGTNQQFQELLQRYTVKDLNIISNQKLIEIDANLSIEQGFEILLSANILSAPVYYIHPDTGKKEYTGFLDVRDLVSSIIYAHQNSALQQPWNESYIQTVCRNKFNGGSLSLTYLSRRNPFKPIYLSTNLLQVAKTLATSVHRLPILNEDGQCITILSQSSLIQFLVQHKGELQNEWKQTIGSLGIGLTSVIAVSIDQSAWNAFKLLELSGVSGIAVIDSSGKLVGNTSARDLKLFVLNRGSLSLDMCILDYLSAIRQSMEINETHPSCSIGLGQTIGHVIELMQATKHHRVFIVDAQGKPIGVISMSDILKFATNTNAGTTEIPIPSPKAYSIPSLFSRSRSNSITNHT